MIILNKFDISVGDDSEHEDLTAEISTEEYFLALMSQEDGFENLQLEIYPCPNGKPWIFRLDEFLKVIEASKQRLWELRRYKKE